MSNVHESVFAKYERRNDVQLDFSEENPMEKYDFGEEIGRLVVYWLKTNCKYRIFAIFYNVEQLIKNAAINFRAV